MKRLRTIILVIFILTFCVGCDQATKKIAKDKLSHIQGYSFLYDTIRLVYVENTGSFLSFGANLPDTFGNWIFIIMPVVMMAILLFYILFSSRLSMLVTIAFSMIAGGGIGNLIDRIIRHRSVIDFMNVGIGVVRTGIFNFADFFVLLGVSILFLESIFSRKTGRKIEI